MASPFNNKKFKSLLAKWYKKLEKDGFVDIEEKDDSQERLKTWHSHDFNHHEIEILEAKREYYTRASSVLETYEFKNDREALIWKLHADGQSVRKISDKLKAMKVKSPNRSPVHRTIQRLKKEIFS